MSNAQELEDTRLDELTAYNSTIVNSLSGELLEKLAKRKGQTDAQMRARILENTHPDDLFADIATAGFSLASIGIASLELE